MTQVLPKQKLLTIQEFLEQKPEGKRPNRFSLFLRTETYRTADF
ncbi:MAG: hypothetical protein V7L20_31305 [Nostoc sp.]